MEDHFSICLYQGSKYHRQREAARKSEAVSGGAAGPSTKTEGHNRNSGRAAGSSNKGEEAVKGDTAAENVPQPQQQRTKDTSNRRPKDNKDTEKARVNINSREFVRGGRGRLHGSARGRGRGHGDHQDVYGSTSHREVESVSQHGSADDVSNGRVASAPSNNTRTSGSEQKRLGDGRVSAHQSKVEGNKSSHAAVVGRQQIPTKEAEDRQSDLGAVKSAADDHGSKAEGLLPSNSGNTRARDAGRQNEIPAQTGRRRTEFYDPRNRQRIRRSDARANNTDKPQEQLQTAPAKDVADVERNVTASSRDIAGTSGNKCLNEEASEETSQRKAGEN